MRVSKCLGLLAALLVLGGPALAEAQYVYVANPVEAQIFSVDPNLPTTQTPVLLFDDKKLPIGDLALSAEGMLYACVPAEGLIFAFLHAAANPLTVAFHQSSGSCSDQPGFGA